jgi:hypothetical protein
MYIHVPVDLGELLEADGFDEIEISSRGADQWSSVAEAVLSTGEKGLDVTTQLVGIYLAREQIADFVRRVAAWLGLRPPVDGGPQSVTFTVTAGPEGAGTRVQISCPAGPDGAPVLDAAALTGAIVSALGTQPTAAG